MSEPAADSVSPEFRRLNTERARTPPLLIILSVAVFLMAGLNLVAAGYMYGALLEMRDLGTRLAEYEKMEGRLNAQIERYSAKVKTEIDASDQKLIKRFESVSKAFSRMKPLLVNRSGLGKTEMDMLAREIVDPRISEFASSARVRSGAQSEQMSLRPRSAVRISSAPPKYKRVERPDGQIYFEKQ